MGICVRGVRGWVVRCLILGGIFVATGGGTVLSTGAAVAQTVNSIVVEGNRRVEADTIRSYFRPGPGGRLGPEQEDEALKAMMRQGIEREYAQVSRARLKRALLDRLAEGYRFGVPGGMVDLEFETIWKQLKEEMERTGEPLPEGKSEDDLKEEYRAIAERRVRLGLILSDIGQKNELKVEQHELNAAIMDQARRYPGQEQKVLDFFRSTPTAVEHLRAPLYEDKVVDFILQMASVSDTPSVHSATLVFQISLPSLASSARTCASRVVR